MYCASIETYEGKINENSIDLDGYDVLTKLFLKFMKVIKALLELQIYATQLKQQKPTPEEFEKLLENIKEDIQSKISIIQETIANSTLEPQKSLNLRFLSFLCNFYFPIFSIGLKVLGTLVKSLKPKKKKAVPAPIVELFNNPMRDTLKQLNEWISTQKTFYQTCEGEETKEITEEACKSIEDFSEGSLFKEIQSDIEGNCRVLAGALEIVQANLKSISFT